MHVLWEKSSLAPCPLPKMYLPSNSHGLHRPNSNHFIQNLKNLKRHSKRRQFNNHQVRLHAVSFKSPPTSSPPQQCYSCGSTTHLQRNCDCKPPFRGKGRNHRESRTSSHDVRSSQPPRSTRQYITYFNCGGLGYFAAQCPSLPLNRIVLVLGAHTGIEHESKYFYQNVRGLTVVLPCMFLEKLIQ